MQLKIGKKKYEVREVPSFKGRAIVGWIDYDKREIRIAKRCGVTDRKRTALELQNTFWHEVVHGVLEDMDSPLYNNERFVTALAKRLTQVIRQVDNERGLVTQRPQGLRKLREKVP